MFARFNTRRARLIIFFAIILVAVLFKVGTTIANKQEHNNEAHVAKILKKTIVMPNYEPTISFKEPGIYMSLKGKQNIPLEVVNIDAIKVKVLKLYDNNLVYLVNNMNSCCKLTDLGVNVIEKTLNTECELNKTKELTLDLPDVFGKDAKGIYLLTVNGAKVPSLQEASKVVVITDLGIVAKKSSSDLLVWLNSLATNTAIANAAIKVYSKTNQQILAGTTDKEGLVHFKGVDWSGDKKPFLITAASNIDVAFLEVEKSMLVETDFNTQSRPYISADYESFLYTDRGIYRPGEKIHFRAVVRNAQAQTPARFVLQLEIKRPDGQQFTTTNATLSEFGSADFEVNIPDYAATGTYTANILVAGNEAEAIGSTKFNIEEFMPDRLNVAIDVPTKSGAITKEQQEDQSDRLDLTFDKAAYKPKDLAKLTIKSPFKGKALITISKGQIISTKIVDLTSEIQEVKIPIAEAFAPNAYCAVTVIRPVQPNNDQFAYRAYGVVPLAIDNSQHQLTVNIAAPLTSLPKQPVQVDINVKQADGKPAKAELSIALVDEGILNLTKFKLPDPYQFFYGQRANKITASDSCLLNKKHLNPINAKRVKPVVLWQSGIVTDAAGKATVEFNIPEFTGNLKLMAVAIANNNFGNKQVDLQVTAPLIVNSSSPRVLATNDEFILPITLFNTTNKDVEAKVTLEVSTGFTILEQPQLIQVKAGKEAIVSFKLTAPNSPGKAAFKIKTEADNQINEETIELAVRPPLPFTVLNGSGVIKAPDLQVITMPFNWLSDTGDLNLTITPLPALQFAGGLKFLLRYPYGCVEQVVSRALPLLYLKDIADLTVTDQQRYTQAAMDHYINAAIQQLLAMQTYTGGFSPWPGYNQVYDWGSIYATDFLVEANKAGYVVPTAAKELALDYCEKILIGKVNEHKAYSAFVLAKAGRIKPSWIRRLQEVKDTLPGYAKFYLASSLYLLGDKTAVADILGKELADKKIARRTDDSLNSYTRENAIALSVYMDIDPNNPMVPVLVNRLQSTMQNGAWDTTQENAAALVALGKYASFIKRQDISYTGTVLQDGKVIAEFNEQKSVALDKSTLVGKEIKVALQGKGQAYYYWNSEGIPTNGKVEEKHLGIKATRTYFTKTGAPLNMQQIKQGDAIVVDIAIATEVVRKNIVIEDILPAGFEIENPHIASSETIEWLKAGIFEPQHVDIRDDRLLVFTDLSAGKEQHYRYIVRAVTAGKFFLPALSVSCMYDPSIVSVSGQGGIEIGKE